MSAPAAAPTIAQELGKLNPSARITLYVVDATALGATQLYRFHNGANELSQPVVWQGHTYNLLPIETEGFEISSDGPAPRPTLRVSNQGGLMGALCRQYGNLLGALLIRKRTRACYLDAVNFATGNPDADPNAHVDDETWVFDQVSARNQVHIEWQLSNALDLENTMVPRHQVRAAVCGWEYRGTGCDYAGPPVADAENTPTANAALDQCSLLVSGCKLRFGPNAWLPIRVFPGVAQFSAAS